jgi:copper chaperone
MIEFQVDGMSCGHCVKAVTQALKDADPHALVVVNLAEHTVEVESASDRSLLAAALSEAGYPPK